MTAAPQADAAASEANYQHLEGSSDVGVNNECDEILVNVAIAIIAEPLFTSYNKTRFMLRTLELAARSVNLTMIGSRDRGLSGKLAQAKQYVDLFRRMRQEPRPDFIFLSEFKFSPFNVTACWLIAQLLKVRLIGGPHTLSGDSDLLTDPGSQGDVATLRHYPRRCWTRFRDRWLIRRFDVLQSYTEQYAARVRSVANQPSKPTVILPLGSALRGVRRGSSCPEVHGELRVMFWGIASALHGLSLLPVAARMLDEKGLCVRFRILSPENHFTREVRRIAVELRVEDHFEFDAITNLSRTPEAAEWAEVAISHLINPGLSQDAQSLVDSLSTNKMYEILDLGIPLLVASTSAVTSLIPPDCAFYCTPGDAGSVANALSHAAHRAIREQTAQRGKRLHDERMTANAAAVRLGRQLDALRRAC